MNTTLTPGSWVVAGESRSRLCNQQTVPRHRHIRTHTASTQPVSPFLPDLSEPHTPDWNCACCRHQINALECLIHTLLQSLARSLPCLPDPRTPSSLPQVVFCLFKAPHVIAMLSGLQRVLTGAIQCLIPREGRGAETDRQQACPVEPPSTSLGWQIMRSRELSLPGYS